MRLFYLEQVVLNGVLGYLFIGFYAYVTRFCRLLEVVITASGVILQISEFKCFCKNPVFSILTELDASFDTHRHCIIYLWSIHQSGYGIRTVCLQSYHSRSFLFDLPFLFKVSQLLLTHFSLFVVQQCNSFHHSAFQSKRLGVFF